MARITTSALTLGSLLIAALLVMVAGGVMSRRQELQRIPANRPELRNLIEGLNAEIDRLDSLYEQHLREITRQAGISSAEELSKLCQDVSGIKLCSIIRGIKPEEAVHYEISPASSDPSATPEPKTVKHLASLSPTSPHLVSALPLSRIFRPDLVEEDQGWEWPPGGDEAVFWVHKNARLVVAFTIDAKAVQDHTGRHLATWLQSRLGRFIERNENLRIDAPWGSTAAQTPGTASSQLPDFSAPLASRWGFWQIQSWDRISDLTRHDAPTLLVTGLVACLLGTLGFTLAQSQKRSQRLAEQRVSFVNQVSHELGTPLTNMLLNLDLAREAVPTDPEGALRRLKLAEEETRRLVRLTENVLSFSRRERNDLCLSPAPCVPDEVVAEVLDHFQAALQRSGVTPECHLHAPHAVTLDRDALAQILSNLLSNVEKYASSGGWFRLETQWQDGWLHLAISDRGPGIPDSEAERIFHPFERLANHTSEGVTGAGLGLSISLELARLMGGDLKLTKQTAGAEFALRVPAPSA